MIVAWLASPLSNAQDMLLFGHHLHGHERYPEERERHAGYAGAGGKIVNGPECSAPVARNGGDPFQRDDAGRLRDHYCRSSADGRRRALRRHPGPAEQTNFPAVHDLPPPRASTVLTDAEQKKLEDDLIAARTRTGAAARAGTRDD